MQRKTALPLAFDQHELHRLVALRAGQWRSLRGSGRLLWEALPSLHPNGPTSCRHALFTLEADFKDQGRPLTSGRTGDHCCPISQQTCFGAFCLTSGMHSSSILRLSKLRYGSVLISRGYAKAPAPGLPCTPRSGPALPYGVDRNAPTRRGA